MHPPTLQPYVSQVGIAAICVTRTELLARSGGGSGLLEAMGAAAAARGVDVLFALTAPQLVYKNREVPSKLLQKFAAGSAATSASAFAATSALASGATSASYRPTNRPILFPTIANQQAEDPAEEGLKSLVAVCSEGLGQGGGLGQALLEPAGCNPCAGGCNHMYPTCNPTCSRLQPYVLEAATLCARGCNPMCPPSVQPCTGAAGWARGHPIAAAAPRRAAPLRGAGMCTYVYSLSGAGMYTRLVSHILPYSLYPPRPLTIHM